MLREFGEKDGGRPSRTVEWAFGVGGVAMILALTFGVWSALAG